MARLSAARAVPPESAWKPEPTVKSPNDTCTPQGATCRRNSTTAFTVVFGSPAGGTRTVTRALAAGWTALIAPDTDGTSRPVTVIAYDDQSRSASEPEPTSDTPSTTPAVFLNSSSDGPWPRKEPRGRPGTRMSPLSSCSEVSMRISAASASGAAPPKEPLWTASRSVRTSTVNAAMPRSDVVTAGSPTRGFPVSATTMASARSRSGLRSTNASSRSPAYSSWPSMMTLMPTGKRPWKARSAVTWEITPDLSSAQPRPYRRPSISVGSNGGVRHAAGSPAGCTS